jgi:hypothetical protein
MTNNVLAIHVPSRPIGINLNTAGIRLIFAPSPSSYPGRIDPLTAANPSLVDLIEAVRRLEYGRPSERSVEAMIRERRGTCSAKHLFLAERLSSLVPGSEPQIVHRVYRIDPERAREVFGKEAAEAVPSEGLVDVHHYLTIVLNGKRVTIDATFPGPTWDGLSDLPLACGPGRDHPSDGDPDAEKRHLEAEHCDPDLRERFIAALAGDDERGSPSGPAG